MIGGDAGFLAGPGPARRASGRTRRTLRSCGRFPPTVLPTGNDTVPRQFRPDEPFNRPARWREKRRPTRTTTGRVIKFEVRGEPVGGAAKLELVRHSAPMSDHVPGERERIIRKSCTCSKVWTTLVSLLPLLGTGIDSDGPTHGTRAPSFEHDHRKSGFRGRRDLGGLQSARTRTRSICIWYHSRS